MAPCLTLLIRKMREVKRIKRANPIQSMELSKPLTNAITIIPSEEKTIKPTISQHQLFMLCVASHPPIQSPAQLLSHLLPPHLSQLSALPALQKHFPLSRSDPGAGALEGGAADFFGAQEYG